MSKSAQGLSEIGGGGGGLRLAANHINVNSYQLPNQNSIFCTFILLYNGTFSSLFKIALLNFTLAGVIVINWLFKWPTKSQCYSPSQHLQRSSFEMVISGAENQDQSMKTAWKCPSISCIENTQKTASCTATLYKRIYASERSARDHCSPNWPP